MPGNDTYTKLLIHSDTTDGSTTFIDSSASGHAITANGNVHHEVDQKKFGATAKYFDGTGDFLSLADSEDWNFGSDDFTIDCWVRRERANVREVLCGQSNASGSNTSLSFMLQFRLDNVVRISLFNSSGTQYYAESTATITDTNWHHLEFARDGNTLRLFVAGGADGAVDVTGVTANNSSNLLAIGRLGEFDGNYFQGYMDEFRISKGIARHTANFTPPTSPYDTGVSEIVDRFIPAFSGFPVSHNNGFLPGLSPSGLIRQTRKGFSKAF